MYFLPSLWQGIINLTAGSIVVIATHVPFLMNVLIEQPIVSAVDSLATSSRQDQASHGDIPSSIQRASPEEGVVESPLTETSLAYPNPSEKILNSRASTLPSPDGKISAIVYSTEEETVTFLTDSEGKQISKVYWGSAMGWAPDQSKVYVFLADRFSKDGNRHVYYLNRDGSISDPRLPAGVYSMSISPDGRNIAYVKSQTKGSDAADIYLRDANGDDRVLVRGLGNIFLNLSWSADSETLFYEKSDLLFRPGMQSSWSVNLHSKAGPQSVDRISN